MQAYFKAVPEAQKFYNAPPDFIPLLEELFKGVFTSNKYAILVQEVINSYINLELLCLSKAAISQVIDPADKEDKREDKEVTKENIKPNLFKSQ